MKTLWNEAAQIEAHISGSAKAGDKLVFEAKLLLQPDLQAKLLWQKKAYAVVQQYGRRQLKTEIEAVHQKLFGVSVRSRFSQKIRRLFTNP